MKLLLVVVLLNAASIFDPQLSVGYFDSELSNSIRSNWLNRSLWFFTSIISIAYIYKFRRITIWSLVNRVLPALLLIGYAFISCYWSSVSSVAFTRFMQQLMIFTFALALSFVLDKKDYLECFYIVAVTIVLINLLTLPLPMAWSEIGYRGIHGHKNSAGLLLAFSAIVLYNFTRYDCRRKTLNIAVLICSFILLVISQSKTSLALVLISVLLNEICFKKGKKLFRVEAILIFCFITGLSLNIFFALVDRDVLYQYGINFTGRLVIWDFVFYEMKESWLLGHGYRSFWGLGDQGINYLFGAEFDNFIIKLNQAHNSYIDIFIMLGLVGSSLFMLFIIFTFTSLKYASADKFSHSLFFMMLLFTVIHSFMESTMFRGSNILWLTLVFIYFNLNLIRNEKVLVELFEFK